MKEGIHPDNYRLVVFKDMSNDYAFLSKSAAETKETIQWEDGLPFFPHLSSFRPSASFHNHPSPLRLSPIKHTPIDRKFF